MAKVAITKSKMDSLANSIAAKSGVPVTMTVDEMKTAVDSILVPAGTLTVTENGVADVKAYENVDVDVPVPDVIDQVSVKSTSEEQIVAAGTIIAKNIYVNWSASPITTGITFENKKYYIDFVFDAYDNSDYVADVKQIVDFTDTDSVELEYIDRDDRYYSPGFSERITSITLNKNGNLSYTYAGQSEDFGMEGNINVIKILDGAYATVKVEQLRMKTVNVVPSENYQIIKPGYSDDVIRTLGTLDSNETLNSTGQLPSFYIAVNNFQRSGETSPFYYYRVSGQIDISDSTSSISMGINTMFCIIVGEAYKKIPYEIISVNDEYHGWGQQHDLKINYGQTSTQEYIYLTLESFIIGSPGGTTVSAQLTITENYPYDALSEVQVEPIPSQYIQPSGTISITSNGTVDVSQYENASVNVSGAVGIADVTSTLANGATQHSITAVDLSNDTVDATHLASGYTAHDSSGQAITGTFTASNSVSSGQVAATGNQILSGYSAFVDGEEVQGNIITKTSSDLFVSGDTVTVPSGYYASSASKSVASGTAGTPTATKGTVSNHSISVTPSVSNTTGYITGSTKTGTAITVSASELVSGSQTIEENDTYDVTNLASVIVNVEGEPGQARIVDTPDVGGGTVRTITTGEETSLTTKTVTPDEYTQIVTGDNYVCRLICKTSAVARTPSGNITQNNYSFTPSTILTLNAKYAIIGRIDVIDSNNEILEYYDINTEMTWDNNSTTLIENDSNAYYKKFTIRSNYSDSSKCNFGYQLQLSGTYGYQVNLAIYEVTDYDGLLQVTVNPIPDTYYRPDLIKNMIQRDTSFKTFNFPEGITTIGSHAFDYCQYLALTSLPDSITLINTYAFYNCSRLALTSLPSGLTTIYGYVFYNCSRLALTSLPSGVTAINDYAFYGCTDLALTSLPSGITSIGLSAFRGCTNLALTSLPSGITTINSNTFYGCTNLALTNLPSGITTISSYAFYGCTNLAITSLPSGVTSIQSNAFQCCTGLTTLSCTGVITTLASSAFFGDSTHHMQLEEVYFPNMALTSNLGYVFGSSTAANACQELEICDIGITTGIANNAFTNCYKLQTLILRKTSVCTLSAANAFINTPLSGYNGLTATVYVPSSLISSYQTASNWSTLYSAGNVTFSAIEGSEYELD